jgi:hypothetical protein
MTFGSGGLDNNGYWEFPCPECARAFEAKHPGEFAWPRKRILWFDNCEYFAEDFLYSGAVPVVPNLRAKPIAEFGFQSPSYWEKKGSQVG